MERQTSPKNVINNQFYDTLQEGWYSEMNHPIALLRAENKLRNPWIASVIRNHFCKSIKVLDIGCGAGLLTNELAQLQHEVYGIDLSESSLAIARTHDVTSRVSYEKANAAALPFEDGLFDVVCAMDVLEHVEDVAQVIQEASRVLKPGGLFFFHTFNRNWLSYLIIIKGVEWFVKNTPPNMHVYDLFITPKELKTMCSLNMIKIEELKGFTPKFFSKAFWKMLFTRQIREAFEFQFTKNTFTGYCGFGKKMEP